MKKRVFGLLLALAMVACLLPTTAMADVTPTTDRTGPYDNDTANPDSLPAAPERNGDVWTVTPENAQYTLDGAYGKIDGKTIRFSAGIYTDVLVLARPTKFEGSGTVYYNMTWDGTGWNKNSDPSEFTALSSNIRTYERTVSNVIFTAEEGVVLPGFSATSGHVYSSGSNTNYDYVIDATINNTGNSYYGASSLTNITFQGLTISGSVAIDNYVEKTEAVNSNIKFQNCKFAGNEAYVVDGGTPGIRMGADSQYFTNITVQNCTFDDYFQAIYIQGADTLTVENCVIDNTYHNAIAIQSSSSNPVKGTITIQENIIRNANDRAIRFGNINEGTHIAINNNAMVNSGDSDGELIKPGTVGNGVTVDLENNYWDGKNLDNAIAGFSENVIPENVGIVSGTFPEDVSDYLAPGVVQNADGSVSEPPYIPPVPSYLITLPDPDNGTVTTDRAAARQGTEVTLTVTPDEGFALASLAVTDFFGNQVDISRNSDGTYSFVMPASQVTVSVAFVPVELPFTDVTEANWYYDEVYYVWANGLMQGTSATTFGPGVDTTRAMVVTILWRLEGEPASGYDMDYSDVAGGAWYAGAVRWATEHGIVNGSEGQFYPGRIVTREQLAAMLYRYAQYKGYDLTAGGDLSGFADAGAVSGWAETSLAWAVGQGLLQGSDSQVDPQGSAIRAQTAAILMRFCENMLE